MAGIVINSYLHCDTGSYGSPTWNEWVSAESRGNTLNISDATYRWVTRISLDPSNIDFDRVSSINLSLPITNNTEASNRSFTIEYFFSDEDLTPIEVFEGNEETLNTSIDQYTVNRGVTANIPANSYSGEDWVYLRPATSGSTEITCNAYTYPKLTITYSEYPESSTSYPNIKDNISDYTDYQPSGYPYFNFSSASGNTEEKITISYTNINNYSPLYICIANNNGSIMTRSSDNEITLPSSAGTYTGYLIGYYSPAKLYYRFDSITVKVIQSNKPPEITNVTFNPSSGIQNQTTSVQVSVSVSDDAGDTHTYYYNTFNTTSGASPFTNGSSLNLVGGKTYWFWAKDNHNEYSDSKSKTFDGASFSVNLNAQPTQKDNSYYPSSTGLVKSFLSLTANASYNDNSVPGANYSWYYKTGTDIDTSPSVNSSETTISGYYGSTITNFDLGNYYSGIAGRAYKIGVKCTYNGATVSAETPVYVYPSPLNEITTYSYNNKNSTSSYANTNSEDFDNNIYLKIKYPTNTYRQYPKISQIHIKFANSPSEGQLENNSNYVTFFSDSSLGSTTSNTTGEGSEENFTISLDNSITGSSLPRNEYFKIQIELIDSSGQSNITNLDEIFYRISKPTFGDTNIGSNRPQTIAVNQLDSSWSWQLAFSAGSMYNLKTYPLTDEGLKQQAIETIKQLEIQLQTLEGSTVSKQIAFTDSNVTANYGNATVYLTITAAELQNLLSDYTSLNTSLEGTLILALEDPFENIATLSVIRFPNSILDDNVIFSFGTPPVLPDYTEPNLLYTLKPIYQYLTPVSGSFYTNLDTSNIETKNMVNYGDKLEFVFPKATDANGNDDGTSHGDILGYRIKIVRSDDRESIQSVSDDNFSVLSEIPFSNGDISYDSSTESYTYQHSVNNYTTSKFIRLGICAYDSTFLESNLIVFPYIIVAGRISPSSLSITSHKVNTNEDGTSYDFRINFSDIGGNLFNNTGYHYSDYPNLERNISGNVNDSRDVKFFIAYRNDATSDFTTSEQLSFKTDKDSSSSINYDPSLSYSSLLTKTIRIEGLTFSQSIIDPAQKAYFKIIAYVQTGFDN